MRSFSRQSCSTGTKDCRAPSRARQAVPEARSNTEQKHVSTATPCASRIAPAAQACFLPSFVSGTSHHPVNTSLRLNKVSPCRSSTTLARRGGADGGTLRPRQRPQPQSAQSRSILGRKREASAACGESRDCWLRG